jgi:hypothetical protein
VSAGVPGISSETSRRRRLRDAVADQARVCRWALAGPLQFGPGVRIRRRRVAGDGDAFERVFAAVGKHRTRARDEIDDGPCHEHLAGMCGLAYAMGEVDGDPCELGATAFDLTGVDADANFEADVMGGVADSGPAAEGTCGPLEGGEDAVTGEFLLMAREPRQLSADNVVVAVEQRCSQGAVLVGASCVQASEVR